MPAFVWCAKHEAQFTAEDGCPACCTGRTNGATFWCDQHFAVGWVGLPCTESPDYRAANLEAKE